MNEGIIQMLHKLVTNFGRPSFDLGSDYKIHEADEALEDIQKRRLELERRLRLLDIQSTPRGT